MTWELASFDGETIWISGDARGVRILIFGRDGVAHGMILLTPSEAGKVINAIGKAIDGAVEGMDGLACKGLADLNKEESE